MRNLTSSVQGKSVFFTFHSENLIIDLWRILQSSVEETKFFHFSARKYLKDITSSIKSLTVQKICLFHFPFRKFNNWSVKNSTKLRRRNYVFSFFGQKISEEFKKLCIKSLTVVCLTCNLLYNFIIIANLAVVPQSLKNSVVSEPWASI